MSKRKKNYPDPLSVIDKYGADALRYGPVLCLVCICRLLCKHLTFSDTVMVSVMLIILLIWFIISSFLKMHVYYMELYWYVIDFKSKDHFLNCKDVSKSRGLLENESLC